MVLKDVWVVWVNAMAGLQRRCKMFRSFLWVNASLTQSQTWQQPRIKTQHVKNVVNIYICACFHLLRLPSILADFAKLTSAQKLLPAYRINFTAVCIHNGVFTINLDLITIMRC